jgi:hypothetical protein
MVIIRIRRPTEYEEEDIGDLDFSTKIPYAEGLKCATCGDKIAREEKMTLGTKTGRKGIFVFHDNCLHQGTLFDGEKE